jgi:hypothetical protein
MPIIVPIEENHEGIAGLTDARFRAPDTSGSGLEALGAGLTKIGQGGEQFASALDEKRRREIVAAIAAAKLDDDHQRNVGRATRGSGRSGAQSCPDQGADTGAADQSE